MKKATQLSGLLVMICGSLIAHADYRLSNAVRNVRNNDYAGMQGHQRGKKYLSARYKKQPLKKIAQKNNKKNFQKLTFKDNKQLIEKIYENISGFNINAQENKMIISQGGAPTYGEITYDSLEHIINDLQLGRHDVFYDLGSGVGKVATQMALNTPVKKSGGIELSQTRYKGALAVKKRLKDQGMREVSKKLAFLNNDMLKADISDATVVYTCSTCFSEQLMDALAQRLSKLKRGLQVLTLKELPNYKNYGFKLVKEYYLPMTWTLTSGSPVYRYELVKA